MLNYISKVSRETKKKKIVSSVSVCVLYVKYEKKVDFFSPSQFSNYKYNNK